MSSPRVIVDSALSASGGTRGTIDMIFSARQIQEECREQNQSLYILYMDLTKASDLVTREGQCAVRLQLDCPPRFVNIITFFMME